MEQELENIDSTNDEIEVIDSEDNETEEVEEVEAKKEEYTPREKQLHARLKKAEAKLKEKVVTKVEDGNLSSSDLLAVMKADVHEDDMERVERFAKSEGQSIKDALKNPELKAILGIRSEERGTANASNVTNTRKGSTKPSDETLISNANRGKLPEDDAGIEALVAAARKAK